MFQPVAYLIGYSYYQGYLSEFGINSDVFPISTQYIYINAYHNITYTLSSFISFFVNALNQLNWYSLLILFVTILTMITTHHFFQHINQSIDRKISSLSGYRSKGIVKSFGIIWIIVSLFFFTLYSLLALTILWWLPSYVAYSNGIKIATKQIDEFNKYGCKVKKKTNLNRCILVTAKDEKGNDKILHEGLLVAINEKEIALFEKDGTHIFARKEEYSLQRRNH